MIIDDESSHLHSQLTLKLLAEHDDFMDCIKTVADMGSGIGLDALWWATQQLESADDNHNLRNIKVHAVDTFVHPGAKQHSNIIWHQKDFSKTNLKPESIDLIWSHNSFQQSSNPLETLAHWWSLLPIDGMLCLEIPYIYNLHYFRNQPRINSTSYPGCYFNYTPITLMMMLASAGFDCRNGHFKFVPDVPWIHAAVYKTSHEPQQYVNWYELLNRSTLPLSVEKAITSKGHVSDSDIIVEWIDHSVYNLSIV
jgi:SAM-dependent methyltransferase